MDWNYREYKPTGIISQYIDCIWMEDYSSAHRSTVHHVIPDNSVELIITDTPIIRYGMNGSANTLKSHLSGLKTQPQRVYTSASPSIGIRFKPHGIRPFIQGAAQDLVDNNLPLETCFGSDIRLLEERILNANSFQQRIVLIEQFFSLKLSSDDFETDKQLEQALRLIQQHKGTVSMKLLAHSLNLSTRSLERKFQRDIGITPKKYLRIVRVLAALQKAAYDSSNTLTQVAQAHRYFDQAHFIKEVQTFTGVSPKAFLQSDRGIQAPLFSTSMAEVE